MCSLLTSYDGHPHKKCFEFKSQPLPGFPAPSKLTLIGALGSLRLIMSTRRWGMGIVYATQDPKFGCCF